MSRLLLITLALLCSRVSVSDGDMSLPMYFSSFNPCAGSASFCGTTILAEGTIESDTDKIFIDFISKKRANDPYFPESPTVCFNSPGGNLSGGIKLGKAIRKLGSDTCISPKYSKLTGKSLYEEVFKENVLCASACVLAFSGGVNRNIEKGSKVGIHQFSGRENVISEGDTQVTVVAIASFLKNMGINRNLLDMASLVPPDQIYWLTDEEVKQLRVDNSVEIHSGWSLDATDRGDVFVRLDQELTGNHNILTFLLQRVNGQYVLSLIFKLTHNTPSKTESALEALNSFNPKHVNLFLQVDENEKSRYAAEWESLNGEAVAAAITLSTNDVRLIKRGKNLRVISLVSNVNSMYDPSTVITLDGLSKYLKALTD